MKGVRWPITFLISHFVYRNEESTQDLLRFPFCSADLWSFYNYQSHLLARTDSIWSPPGIACPQGLGEGFLRTTSYFWSYGFQLNTMFLTSELPLWFLWAIFQFSKQSQVILFSHLIEVFQGQCLWIYPKVLERVIAIPLIRIII